MLILEKEKYQIINLSFNLKKLEKEEQNKIMTFTRKE